MGNQITLDNFNGQYLLIVFWASYDKESLKFLKNLYQLHSKYNRGGFDVLAVSLDKSVSEWLEAIQHNDLGWAHHVSGLSGLHSKSAIDLNITFIPYSVLLNEQGTIVDKGEMYYSELDQKI